MDITSQILNRVKDESSKNALSYNDFINIELGTEFLSSTAPRVVDDVVSYLGLVSSQEGLLALSYSTLSGIFSHSVSLRYEHNTLTGLHTHNHIELAYVVKGRLKQLIAGKTEVFEEGEACLIDWESLHGDYLLHEEATVVFIGIDTNFFNHHYLINKKATPEERRVRELMARRKWQYNFVRFKPKNGGISILRTLELIYEELSDMLPCKVQIVSSYLERLLSLLTGEYHIDLSKKDKGELSISLFKDMERHIGEHYATVTIKDLAHQYNYNPDYLSRLCQKNTGLSLSRYIQQIRMEAAVQLLEHTDLPIEQIVNSVGYHNIGFFYQKFKERYGATPQSLRYDKQ